MVKGVIPRPMRPALGCPCNRLQERVARDAQIAWHHIHLGALRQLHVWRQDNDAVLHRSGITHGLNILSAAQARKHGLPPPSNRKTFVELSSPYWRWPERCVARNAIDFLEQLLGYGRSFRPGEVKRRLREVTAGEIRAVPRDFFRPERLNLALVSPLNTHHCKTAIR